MDASVTLDFSARPAPPISNGRLGMMLLIGTETILFSCFIGAYLVLRMGAAVWPLSGTPVLTLGLSAINTVLLVFSSALAIGFRTAARRGLLERSHRLMTAAWISGALFLGLQALEFHRLYARGLTLQTGAYGALFYSLITCHGLHVLGGLAIFGYTLRSLTPERAGHAELYWHFVTGIWLVLFAILYLL